MKIVTIQTAVAAICISFFSLGSLAKEVPVKPLTQNTAQAFKIHKLTGEGALEIQVQVSLQAKTSNQSENTDPEKTITSISVLRKTLSVEKSRWKSIAKKENLKIIMVGDSGCRLKEGKSGDDYQDCSNPKVWPFPQVMKQVAKEKPDLIVHLGDFHYREHCSKGKPCEKMSKVVGYGWEPWRLDFFEPAKPTFSLAPWIFVRGNHEDCKRAYLGYFHLMANEDLQGACKEYEEADLIALKDLMIINLDTSAVPDAVDPSAENTEIWAQRLKALDAQVTAKGIQNVWIVTHKPIYGLVKMNMGLAPVNPNLKKYLEASPLKNKVKLIFAGHVHLSQIIKPMAAPLQFVLGNGGTQLDEFDDIVNGEDLKRMNLESVQTGSAGFGYAVFTRKSKAKDWKVEFKDEQGKVSTSCRLQVDQGICLKPSI